MKEKTGRFKTGLVFSSIIYSAFLPSPTWMCYHIFCINVKRVSIIAVWNRILLSDLLLKWGNCACMFLSKPLHIQCSESTFKKNGVTSFWLVLLLALPYPWFYNPKAQSHGTITWHSLRPQIWDTLKGGNPTGHNPLARALYSTKDHITARHTHIWKPMRPTFRAMGRGEDERLQQEGKGKGKYWQRIIGAWMLTWCFMCHVGTHNGRGFRCYLQFYSLMRPINEFTYMIAVTSNRLISTYILKLGTGSRYWKKIRFQYLIGWKTYLLKWVMK